MPTYDYQCRSCGWTTEVIHSMLESGPTVCERCGGELRRILYPTGIIFKGSGFYRTDSRANGSGGTTPTTEAPKETTPSGSDSKPAPSSDGGGAKPAKTTEPSSS